VSVASFVEDFRRQPPTGPAWLAPIRRTAIDRFAAAGFPTPRTDEDWHFTSVAPIAESSWTPLVHAGGQVHQDDLLPFKFGGSNGSGWIEMVFVNGRFAPDLSTLSGLPARVRVEPLGEDEVVRRYLTTLAPTDVAFTALNTAFMTEGALIHIPANEVVERPIHLLFVTDSEAARGVTYPRTLIVAGRHSRATIVESYVSASDAVYFTNAVTEVDVAEGAHLAHYRMQRESDRAYHVGTTEVRQARDSRYHSFSFATGAALSRINVYDVLAGQGGEATLDGLYLADGTQHIDHQTRIEHVAPNCASREVYKGVLDDAAHGVFNGKVYVHAEAQKTDGKQTNNNLLLSDQAHADTKPQLEIFADDVKCTHGATVGRLDEVALFYLKSRGINADTARTLLTYAFAADVLQRIDDDTVRTGLEALVLERFVGTTEAVATV
jgi:Fe-S cluster assembly protein SufD